MLEDRYNSLPPKKTKKDCFQSLPAKKIKSNVFSVRLTDKDHKAVLKMAHALGDCRANTFVEMALKGLQFYAKEHGISLSEEDIDRYLAENGIIEPEQK